ncbi:hypothetical protein SPRA44_350093 [Serratia proteamaculans]|nr:hypothetical protein SPRA44_350093 [Serratia proteamaculans]
MDFKTIYLFIARQKLIVDIGRESAFGFSIILPLTKNAIFYIDTLWEPTAGRI